MGLSNINLNLNVRGLPVSATLDINEKSNKLLAEGKQIYKFGLGQSPFPVPQVVVNELRNNAHQKDYLPVRGYQPLREAIANYLNNAHNLTFSGDDIIVGPGSKELMFIIQLVYYGDLLIPTPSWVSYAPQAEIIGRHVYWLKTSEDNKWLLTAEELDKFCSSDATKPRILILNYPNNPTGLTYTKDELKSIAEVARKYGIIVLSDEIYGETHHDGNHYSIAKYYPEGTIISTGLSKWCGAGGWRLGTFAFPKNLRWLLDAMAVVASETFTSTSAPIQYAAVRAFQGGIEIERYLWNSRRILKAIGSYMHEKFISTGISVDKPEGAFYMFPSFKNFADKLKSRSILNSSQMCSQILEDTGVAILPGSAFGRPSEEYTARLAYVDFDGAKAIASVEVLAKDKELDIEFLEKNCEKVIIATERLCDWFKSL
ncbi:aminotransferase class I/II-fold pyridoxal phosphate-dependent enzyme [Deferribacterales bacterium Es71-Z0220]|jgi:aspartate aminotransferase|uniref:pyridoxal phosphate-dependent aminotransferase n=1 Tax=Deferrivibrio essentukiensis TaxID=2880922 RepID=UPI001F620118|nr:aminotransferase class I/II-fold pyridoxal phosphate-dependent enzyme [Deferrivibrio essentukiensis]MBZ4672931.1 Aspartate transaminase [Deferribacteraceae bacterium]MCB4204854.1 aminotransferase class I/II-fold pyridoxal phosphate-dependent enzyme [Deferrivibrio essentukiensis]